MVTTYGLVATMDAARGAALRQIVSGQGLEAVVTRDGDEARSELRARGAPGIVVTDLVLPRTDGFALLRNLRSIASAEETPAIAMSAFADLRAAAERMRRELGLTAVLPAQASDEIVLRAVKRALDRDVVGTGLIPDVERPAPPPATVAPLRLRPHDGALSALASAAAKRLGVPVLYIALASGDRIVVPARVGVESTPEAALLVKQVVGARQTLVVPLAGGHPLFRGARAPAALAGYAAAPITTSRGDVLGAVCVADEQPLALGPAELEELMLVARQVAGELEIRSQAGAGMGIGGDGWPHLAEVLGHLDSGVALLDAGHKVLYANVALAEMVDLPLVQLAGMARDVLVGALAPLGADPDVAARVLRVGAGSYAAREDLELARPRRRVVRWIARPLHLGAELGQLELFHDITAEIDLARERELLARTDWLTGLVNRRGGAEAIAREVARARRLGSTLCFAMFDIDEFKRVNDLFGHMVGDEVLREVSRLLLGAVRGSDLAIRWGGDELLVVLPAIQESGARVFAERVRKRIAELKVKGLPRVTVSGGVAELQRLEDAGQAIARSDARLYEAKGEGRNRVK